MPLDDKRLGSPGEIMKRTRYEAETSFMLMMQRILLFLRHVPSKETKLMYKKVKDYWILGQESSSLVAGVYLLRDSLSCYNKETYNTMASPSWNPIYFSLNPEKSSQG